METVLQYEIPVLHPLAVHFPIALLSAAAGFSLVWLLSGARLWRRLAAALMVVGSVGAAFAYLTGETVRDLSEDIPIVEELVELHETVALATLWVAVAMAISALFVEWVRRAAPTGTTDPLPLRIALFAGFVAVAALVLFTGHVGGLMVWGVAR